MENKNNIKDDELIRSLMQSAKKEAPENLKYRIMHQIETEALLSRQQKHQEKSASNPNPLRNFWSVFGIMYAVLALIAIFFYFTKGEQYLLSVQFFSIVLLVSFIFSIFWMMTKVEERYRQKRDKH